MPERTLGERLDRMAAALTRLEESHRRQAAVTDEIDALLDDLEAVLFPSPTVTDRPKLELVAGPERQAA